MADGDAVAKEQKENPAHAGVTSFYLVHHENFELLGGPFGPSDKYEDGIDPSKGPVALSKDELWPVGTQELDEAKKAGSVAQYVAEHRVKNRFVYVFSVLHGQFFGTPTFRYELHIDDKGRVHSLSRDDFMARHANPDAVAEEPNDKYIADTTWEGGKHKFFQQKLPLIKHNKGVTWHFFAVPFHLSKAAVEEIEKNEGYLSPDPGFDPDAPEKSKVEGMKIWKNGSKVAVDNGMLVRVLDPLYVGESMHAELAAAVSDTVAFSLPVGATSRAHLTQRRTLISAIAGCATGVIDRSNNVDLKEDTIQLASVTWPELEQHCFTPEEVATIDRLTPTKASLMKAVHGHEYFLMMEKRLREDYQRRQCKAAVKTLLWLTSMPWAFVEKETHGQAWRIEAFGHAFVCAMSSALAQACDTDVGRNYLNALIEACEETPNNDKVPNAFTTQKFVIRDKPAPDKAAQAKIMIKAGKAPYDLWSRLVTLYGAKNKEFLDKVLSGKGFDPKIIDKLKDLIPQKQVLSLSGVLMARRLNHSFGFNLVKGDITEIFAPEGKSAVVVFTNAKKGGTGVDRSYSLVFDTADDLDEQIKDLQAKGGLVNPKPRGFHKLEFDHVSTVMGFVNMFFAARDIYIAAKKDKAFDAAKSSFALFNSIYSMPWVQKKLASRMQNLSLSFLSKEANVWVAARGIPIVAFAIQVITVAFAAEDLWKKAKDGTTEEVVGSALALTGEILILIAMGMVVASGGVATPASCAVALIGLALTLSSFVYTQFIPTDQHYALNHCIFGKEFPSTKTGRPWQRCLGRQLHYYDFHGKSGATELDTYRRQISAFSNLIHNFNVVVVLSDDINDRGAEIVIEPSAVPRTAYFEVAVTMQWWVRGENDDVTWSKTLSFHYFPYAENLEPLAEPAKSATLYNSMHNRGIFAPSGGGFLVYSSKSGAHPIELTLAPTKGDAAEWFGDLENIIGSNKTPVHLPLRYEEAFSAQSKMSLDGSKLGVRMIYLAETTEGLSVSALDITVALQKYIENQPFGVPENKTFSITDWETKVNQHGRETIEFVVPIDPGQFGQQRVVGFRLHPVYRDQKLGETAINPGETEPMTPGTPELVHRSIVKKSSTKGFDFTLHYAARMVHVGNAVVFDFKVMSSTLSDPGDATKFRNGAIAIDKLVVQYLVNQAPDGTTPKFKQLMPVAPAKDLAFRGKVEDGSIAPYDEVAVRFTANVRDANGNEVWTAGPFAKDKLGQPLVAGLGWEDRLDESRTMSGGRIKSAECAITMVMDGDPSTGKFMPNSIVNTTGRADLTTKAKFLDLERGLPISTESDKVAAIDACKC